MEELSCRMGRTLPREGKKPTIVLKAVADGGLWIWACLFGKPGSLNIINILYSLPIVNCILQGYCFRGSSTPSTGTHITTFIFQSTAFICSIQYLLTPSRIAQRTRRKRFQPHRRLCANMWKDLLVSWFQDGRCLPKFVLPWTET